MSRKLAAADKASSKSAGHKQHSMNGESCFSASHVKISLAATTLYRQAQHLEMYHDEPKNQELQRTLCKYILRFIVQSQEFFAVLTQPSKKAFCFKLTGLFQLPFGWALVLNAKSSAHFLENK